VKKLVILFALFLSSILLAENSTPANPAEDLETRLSSLARSRDSVELTLPDLPDEFFKRENFVIAYDPRGRQKGFRIILFDDLAENSLSYTIDRSAARFDTFELFKWTQAHRAFHAREVDYRLSADKRFSGTNPEHCLSCHDGDQRSPSHLHPNFDSAKTWARFFGNRVYAARQTPGSPNYAPKEEIEAWADFSRRAKKEPLLARLSAHLPLFQNPEAPFAELEKEYHERVSQSLSVNLNGYLARLMRLNSYRVAHLLKETKGVNQWKFAVLAAVASCSNLASFFPAETAAKFNASLKAARATRTKEYAAERAAKISSFVGKDAQNGRVKEFWPHAETPIEDDFDDDADNIEPLSLLSAVIDVGGLGDPHMEVWSLSFTEDKFSFSLYDTGNFWVRTDYTEDPASGKRVLENERKGVFEALLEEYKLNPTEFYKLTKRKPLGKYVRQNLEVDCDALKKRFEESQQAARAGKKKEIAREKSPDTFEVH